MEQYADFAYYYDKLTYDVEYEKIADFVKKIFDKYANGQGVACVRPCVRNGHGVQFSG